MANILQNFTIATPWKSRVKNWDSPWLNSKLIVGLIMVLSVVLLGIIGSLVWDRDLAYVASSPQDLPPAWVTTGTRFPGDAAHPLGTDNQGRDILAVLIAGAPGSLQVGFTAAGIGLLIGIILGTIAGYFGGKPDAIIRTLADSIMTVPTLAILIVISSYARVVDLGTMSLILGLMAWTHPTRVIRSQVLTLRERGYVRMALLSGVHPIQIIFVEMVPNMLPWLAASFASSVSSAILAAASLEALGLGPTRIPTLGMTIFYAINSSAILRGMWWWWGFPIIILIIIFVGLFLIATGMDEIANPRLRGLRSTSAHSTGQSRQPRIASEAVQLKTEAVQAPNDAVLEVKNLCVQYETPRGNVIAANDVSFKACCGEILGLVGESGCGKSTVAMAILQMVQSPGRIVSGSIALDGTNIVGMSEAQLRHVRWRKLSLIPQGAMNSLNPVMSIKAQIQDAILAHENGLSSDQLKKRILELLSLVGLPARVYDLYPHELSGGMKQRVCIAMSVALNPSIIIADEPTSALDVVVQRVVAQTLLDVKKQLGVSMIMIGHDMGLQAQLVDRIAVMYAGNMLEISPVKEIFGNPRHPYTQLLISSIPSIKQKRPLKVTEGLTHDLRNPPLGCAFQFRCPKVVDHCREVRPPMINFAPDIQVACHMYDAMRSAN